MRLNRKNLIIGTTLFAVTGLALPTLTSLIAGMLQPSWNIFAANIWIFFISTSAAKVEIYLWKLLIYLFGAVIGSVLLCSFILNRFIKNNQPSKGLEILLKLDDYLLLIWKRREEFKKDRVDNDPRSSISSRKAAIELLKLSNDFLSLTIGQTQVGLFLLEPNNPNLLKNWFHSNSFEFDGVTYSISKNDPMYKSGVVSSTFRDNEEKLTCLTWDREAQRYIASNKEFIFTFEPTDKCGCSYKAMLTIPLWDLDGLPIGVIAFYSQYVDAFESMTVKKKNIWIEIAIRISAAFALLELVDSRTSPSP